MKIKLIVLMPLLLGLIVYAKEEQEHRHRRVLVARTAKPKAQAQRLHISVKPEYKDEVTNWYSRTIDKTLTQEEISLVAQRMYYLFALFNETFKKAKPEKAKIVKIFNALNEINTKIDGLEHSSDTKKAFDEINKRLNDFKIKKDISPEGALSDYFYYLSAVYEVLYNALDSKIITIGLDKGKKLTTLNIPSEQEIKKVLNKIITKIINEKENN
jgi:predicted HNH restriction endonuclease